MMAQLWSSVVADSLDWSSDLARQVVQKTAKVDCEFVTKSVLLLTCIGFHRSNLEIDLVDWICRYVTTVVTFSTSTNPYELATDILCSKLAPRLHPCFYHSIGTSATVTWCLQGRWYHVLLPESSFWDFYQMHPDYIDLFDIGVQLLIVLGKLMHSHLCGISTHSWSDYNITWDPLLLENRT